MTQARAKSSATQAACSSRLARWCAAGAAPASSATATAEKPTSSETRSARPPIFCRAVFHDAVMVSAYPINC